MKSVYSPAQTLEIQQVWLYKTKTIKTTVLRIENKDICHEACVIILMLLTISDV